MEEAGASFTEKDKQFLYKTQILFTASKSLALLAVDATPRPCNVSVQLMLSHPCDTLFISMLFTFGDKTCMLYFAKSMSDSMLWVLKEKINEQRKCRGR